MSELEIWTELGNLYYNTGAYDQAIRIYKKAIALDQDCGQAKDKAALWNQLGEITLKLKDFPAAMASYQQAAELDPDNTAFLDNLAEAERYARRADQDPAVDAGEEEETVPELLSGLLDTLKSREPETASWVFKENHPDVPADETLTDAPEPLPVVLGSRILSDAAAKEAVEENPAPPEMVSESTLTRMQGLLRLGLLHWRKGESERAFQFLKIALDALPGPKDHFLEALCYDAIARVETDLGMIADAIQAYQSAASLAPEQIFPWNSVANLNCMLDRYEDALAAFHEAVEHDPKDAASWNGLGDVQHKLGRYEDAIAAYQLGNVFEKQGQAVDALSAYELELEAGQENPLIWNEAGDIYYETGAYDDAIASYRKAIELDPVHSYAFQDHLKKAEQAWEQARIWERASAEYQVPGPETMPASAPEDCPPAETCPAETAAPEPAALQLVDLVESETSEKKSIPAVLSSLFDGSSRPEPDAAYWVFKTDPALENVLQTAAQYSPAMAETAVIAANCALQASPEPAYTDYEPLLEPAGNTGPLLVQLPPRAAQPVRLEGNPAACTTASAWETACPEVFPGMHKIPSAATEISPAVSPTDPSAGERASLESDISAYRRVTELNPGNDRAWDALGNMYEAIGLHSEAIAAFEQAIALGPQKEVYYYHLGIALAYQMHYDKAIQALETVVALNPDYVLAHCALAAYYRRIGWEAKAQKHADIARPSMEDENEYNRACFESISGDVDQAFALLEIALKKEQAQPAMLRSDPDLDFIRSDPRFEALLNRNRYVSQ